jgi:enoyl-[acyl-carrier protein] reductase II
MVGQTQVAGQTIPVLRFMRFPPNAVVTGDIEAMDLLAGQSVELVHEMKPAATIVRDLVEGAHHLIEQRLTPILALQEQPPVNLRRGTNQRFIK